ncbi:glycosyl hydrolase [Trinickia terrae]|uniref:Glycosyl hydrolase n=1 Tax=Trinickia terrae TaxID=2571161 RepID=A0A4U1HJA0_9BURK|nr:YCF48-related protein [Trinickia terrae]TKC81255.1 glycosyl hydrolase [Trinickia terrae]
MKSIFRRNLNAALLALCGATSPFACAAEAAPDVKPQLQLHPAEQASAAAQVQLLGAARAGNRLVVVGDHGVVLLSDDDGKTYRQAKSVAADVTLTSVSFADAHNGWAVGHWGVILRTRDGGETWTLQRSDIAVDQPLFSAYFKDANEGWAVGLWSLMLHTTDGGATWTTVKLPPPPGAKKADRNLYALFADAKGTLYVACEQGRVMRSTDSGATWAYAETGYPGSFWTGVALRDGTVLVGGLRGTIYRSADGGATWQASKTRYKSSVTGLLQVGDKRIVASSLDGVSLTSDDDGASFTGKQREDRVALTAVVAAPGGQPVYLSTSGVAKP